MISLSGLRRCLSSSSVIVKSICLCCNPYKLLPPGRNLELFPKHDLKSSFGSWSAVLNILPQRSFHSSDVRNKAQNLYEVLGVSRNASSKDIKKAYYELAKKYHPDTNKDDPQAAKKFQEVSSAYEVLSDEKKRQEYDQWGSTTEFGTSQSAGTSGFAYRSEIDPEELFRKIFGDFPFQGKMYDFNYAESKFGFGASEEVVLNLTFDEAARGVNKRAVVNVVDICPNCKGSCCMPGAKMIRCTHCNATGMETISTGPFVMKTTCRVCHGTGMFNRYPCNNCDGRGSCVQARATTISVPAGVEDGQTVRTKVGHQEVFVTFRIIPSKYFRREGADVYTNATVSLSQAVLGGQIKVQGIYGDLFLKVPPGTSSHTNFKFSGKGIRRSSGYGFGDHYVDIKIDVPKNLSPEQYSLFKSYAELESNTPGSVDGVSSKQDHGERYAGKESKQEEKKTGLFERIKSAIFG